MNPAGIYELDKALKKGCKSILTALLLQGRILIYGFAKKFVPNIFILLLSVACLTNELNMGIAHK